MCLVNAAICVYLWLRLHQLNSATRMLFMAELGHRDHERCSLPSPRLHRGRPISICASTSESSAIKVTSSGEKLHAVMFAQTTQVLSVLPQSRAPLVSPGPARPMAHPCLCTVPALPRHNAAALVTLETFKQLRALPCLGSLLIPAIPALGWCLAAPMAPFL